MRSLRISVPDMTCRHGVRSVSWRLRAVVGVWTVAADAAAGIVVVSGSMAAADVLSALDDCGFPGRVVT